MSLAGVDTSHSCSVCLSQKLKHLFLSHTGSVHDYSAELRPQRTQRNGQTGVWRPQRRHQQGSRVLGYWDQWTIRKRPCKYFTTWCRINCLWFKKVVKLTSCLLCRLWQTPLNVPVRNGLKLLSVSFWTKRSLYFGRYICCNNEMQRTDS